MLFSFFVLAIVFVISCILYDTKKPPKFPPGPPWLSIVGNFPEVKRKRAILGFQHLIWREYHNRYGPIIGLRLGRLDAVVVSSAQGIREVMTRDEFSGRPNGFFFRLRTFGKPLGIIFTDGGVWQRQRKFFLHHLKQFGYGRRQMEDQISEEVIDLVDKLKKRCHELINVNNLFDISVLNGLWAMIAGKRFNLEDKRLLELMDIMHEQFRNVDSSGGLLNQMPFLRFLAPKLSGYSRVLQIHERTWDFLRETIAEHKQSLCAAGHERDFIDSFLQKMTPSANSKETFDVSFNEEQLLSICKDMFMAGSETTSNSLEFLVLYMIKYPEVQKKMQLEMDTVVGKNRWPTLQDRNSLPYVDAVISETQRCSTIAPMGIPHRSTKDTELMGYCIPKGTTVLTNLYQIHMDPEFWGDPDIFRPERFLEMGFKQEALDTYFVPFGFGQRRCIGETIAKANLFLITSGLFYNFTVSVPQGFDPPTLKAHDGIALSPFPYEAQFSIRH